VKCAVYCRVSGSAQEKDGSSLDTQREACIAYAKEKGYDVNDDSIILETYSGLSLERPLLTSLRDRARNRDIDAIIVHTPDRLARVGEDILLLVKEFKVEGVKPLFVKEQWDDTLNGKLVAFMLGWASEFEASQIRERSIRGKVARREKGKLSHGGGSNLYGYNYVRGKGTGEGVRYRNDEQDKWVQEIFNWYANENLSIDGIVLRLNSQGVRSPSGNNHWGRRTIQKMLNNPCYCGHTFVNKECRAEAQKHRKEDRKYKLSSVMVKPKEEWIELPNATPAIISEELFDKAQQRLTRNRELARRNAKLEYLLSGYAYCSRDGHRYIGGNRRNKTRSGFNHHRFYHCTSRGKFEPCGNRTWSADQLEGIVWQEIENVLLQPDIIMAGIKALQEDKRKSRVYLEEFKTIEARLKHFDKEKDRLWKAYAITGDEAKFTGEIKTVMAEISELENRKAELENRIEMSEKAELSIEGIKRACELVRANLTDLSYENKRLALEALGIKVWIDKQELRIEGFLPIEERAIERTTPMRHSGGKSSWVCWY